MTDTIHSGLDVERGISAANLQRLGETVLLWRDDDLAGFAVCHFGAGTGAGSGTCYIKFGAVRNGAAKDFADLLNACALLAADESASRLVAGVNMGHHRAYRELLDRGFRTELEGVALHRGNDADYRDPDVFVMDDWR